jgi:hypothetical protein
VASSGEHDAPVHRQSLRQRAHRGNSIVQAGLGIDEGIALGTVHHGPGTHLIAAKYIAGDIAQVDHDHAARGQQQEIDVQRTALSVRHQHVTQVIEAAAGHRKTANNAHAPALIPAPQVK